MPPLTSLSSGTSSTSTSPSSRKGTELALYYHVHSLLILEGQLIQYQLEQLERLNQATPAFDLKEAELNGDDLAECIRWWPRLWERGSDDAAAPSSALSVELAVSGRFECNSGAYR